MTLEKKSLHESRQLERYQRQINRQRHLHYFILMLILVTLSYIIDEISTNINSSVTTNVIFDLFHITSRDITSDEYVHAANVVAILGLSSVPISFIAPFYKSLADRFGRRAFLSINTFGMALGMLIIMCAPNPYVYMLGLTLVNFVIPNDVHILYIMESVQPKHRVTCCNLMKAISILGISSIGILRKIFVSSAHVASWRMLYLIPTLLAGTVSLLTLLLLTETPVFLKKRVRLLTGDPNQSDNEQNTSVPAPSAKGSVFKALKFICQHKQLRYLAICAVLFSLTSTASSFFNPIMVGGGMTELQISNVIFYYPFIYALITFLSGLFSDKWGRKTTCLFFGSLSLCGLILFIFATKFVHNSVVAGIFYGCYIGGLWSAGDTLLMTMPQESSPTFLRASIVGVFSLTLLSGIIGLVLVLILYNFFRDYGWLCFCLSVPFMFISLLLLYKKVHETKDVDLNTITGSEWD